MSPPTRRTPAEAGAEGSGGDRIDASLYEAPDTEPTIAERCRVTGLNLEVSVAGLLDEAVTLILRRALDETTALAEDVHAYRLTAAARRCRQLADLLDRAEPDVTRWVDARARALAERFEELAA